VQRITRAKNILLSPGTEWQIIKAEKTSERDLFFKYALVLGLIPSLCGLLGYLIFGIYIKQTRFQVHPGSAILWSVVSYVFNMATVLMSGYVIDAFSRTFRTTRDLNASMKVVIYSFTPVWLSGIFYLIPSANFLTTAGWIYMVIIMYFGLKIVKNVPGDRAAGYELLVYCVMVVFYYFTNLILTALAFGKVISG